MAACCVLVYFVGIVGFIRDVIEANAQTDVLPAVLREMKEAVRHPNSRSQQTLSEALQEVVKKRRMTWFHFAQYLLRSIRARPFIFEIANYPCGPGEF